MPLTPKHRFLLFLGPPGCGKGTQSHLLTTPPSQNTRTSPPSSVPHRHKFLSISAGDVLRRESKSNVSLRKMLAEGAFAPEELTRTLMETNVQHLLQLESDQEGGNTSSAPPSRTIILDGYPRTPHQLEYILDKWHDSVHLNAHNTSIFELLASTEAIMERLQGRSIHLDSGRTYHEKYRPPRMPGLDDLTREPLTRREDDSHPDIIQRRIQNYNHVSRPMLDTLRAHGFQIHQVPQGSIDEVHQHITNKLDQL